MKYIIKNINDFTTEDIDKFYDKIYKEKKEKIAKYKNNITKVRSIIGEIILSELLTKNKLSYNDLKYNINEYGKPYIKNKNLFFNISHSFDYVVVAISNNEIGIDIEKVRKTSLNIINKIATKKEKKYILSTPNKINERIFKIFTLKEAYFKMLGKDLKKLLEIEFIINNNNVVCSNKKVKAGFINVVDGYVIAYCKKIEI